MINPGESLFTLMLALLWIALGAAALVWLVMVGGLLRNAAELLFSRGSCPGRPSGLDKRFLRCMRIRP
jgi:hypothetical protein